MKLPSLLLCITVPIVYTDQRSSGYLKKVHDLLQDDGERFSNLRNKFQGLAILLANSNASAYHSEIALAINEPSGIYLKFAETVSETCAYNQAICDQVKDLPVLDENSENFYETADQVLKDQVKHFKTISQRTLEKKSQAYSHIEQIKGKLMSAAGKLDHLKENLHLLSYRKIADLQKEIEEADDKISLKNVLCFSSVSSCTMLGPESDAAQRTKQRVQAMLSETNEILDDSDSYVRWLEESIDKLISSLKDDVAAIISVDDAANRGESTLSEVENLLSDRLEKQSEETVVRVSNTLRSETQDVCNACSDLSA